MAARCASSRAKDVEIMTMKMDRMRNRRRNTLISNLLDNPVHPLALSCKLNQVLRDGERVVVLLHVAQDGIAPLYIDSGGVNAPDDNVLVVCADVRKHETDVEGVGLGDKLGGGADDVADPGSEWAGLDTLPDALCAIGIGLLSGWGGFLDAAIGNDGKACAVVGGVAAEGFGLDAEPVVA